MTILHLAMVQSTGALVWNLIMINLQTARERVSQTLTLWMTTLKLEWNHTKTAQLQLYLSSLGRSFHRFMCTMYGMYSTITSMSATAIPKEEEQGIKFSERERGGGVGGQRQEIRSRNLLL